MSEVLKEVWPLVAAALLYALGWLMQKEASRFTLRQHLPWDQCVYELFSHHGKFVVRLTTAKLPKDVAGFSIARSGKYSLTLSRRLTTEERKFFSAVTLAKLMDEQSDDSHIIAVDRKLTLNEVRRAEALLAELSLCPTTRAIIPLNNILSRLVSPTAQIRRNVSWIGIQVKKVVCASLANWPAEACLKRTPWTTVSGILTAISVVIVVIAGSLAGLAAAGVIGSWQPVPTPASSTAIPNPDLTAELRIAELRITALVMSQEAMEGTTLDGGVYQELGQYDQARENCQLRGHDGQSPASSTATPNPNLTAEPRITALVIPQEAGDHPMEGTTPDGGVYQELGQYDQAPENYQLRGHDGQWEPSVAFSPDSRMLASGVGDTVILWDIQRRQQIGEPLRGHSGLVTSVAFSPDGRVLASGRGDGTVILWDPQSRQQIGGPLRGGDSAVSRLAFSPDSRILASGGGDTVVLWDTQRCQQIGEPLQVPHSWVNNIAFSPDSRILASIWKVGPG